MCYFIFKDILCKQKDRVTVASLLGPTLANAILYFYERKWLEKCPLEFKPVFYRGYVDDIFLFYSNQPIISKNFVTTLILVTRMCPIHLRVKKRSNDLFRCRTFKRKW